MMGLGYSPCSLGLLLVDGVEGRQRCAQAQRPCRQRDVLHCWIDRGAGVGLPWSGEAWHNPYGCLVKLGATPFGTKLLRLPLFSDRGSPGTAAPAVAAARSVGTALKNTTEQRIRNWVRLQAPHRARCTHDLERIEVGHCPASQQFVPSNREQHYSLVRVDGLSCHNWQHVSCPGTERRICPAPSGRQGPAVASTSV
jgi:hypothetical protein